MAFAWPPGFHRVPDDEWTRQPVESLAVKYDTVEAHGWYANLDPTVEDVAAVARDGDVLIDYSGGTGILIDRLVRRLAGRRFGVINVDSSPKFLRLALEKHRDDPRVAFRLIRYVQEARRLEFVDEVLGDALVGRGCDGLISTNAVHLYYDLGETLASWRRVLRPGAPAFVQSGNIGRTDRPSDRWIIDATVDAVQDEAARIVRSDPAYAAHRAVLDDGSRMKQHEALRQKYFLPVRHLSFYLDALSAAGFETERVVHRPITARTADWYEFLAVYHEGVLGWIGGVEKIDGATATAQAVKDRLDVLKRALSAVLGGQPTFQAEWTYITARRR